jgi:Cation efflux family
VKRGTQPFEVTGTQRHRPTARHTVGGIREADESLTVGAFEQLDERGKALRTSPLLDAYFVDELRFPPRRGDRVSHEVTVAVRSSQVCGDFVPTLRGGSAGPHGGIASTARFFPSREASSTGRLPAVAHDHGHAHGLVDRSIVRSRAGVRAVAISLGVLGLTAAIQAVIFVESGSVALLADLIHNAGDALTAVPLGVAFFLRSERAEQIAGYFVVLAIFVSACVAFVESVDRLIHPQELSHLWALAAAGGIGVLGNEIAAQVRLRAGRRLSSPALVADGNHARIDAFVSLGVVLSAGLVAIGLERADPIVGMVITLVILRITWDSWRTIRHGIH